LKFASFWAAVSAIVDETSALPKHKMLKLKARLEEKAAEAIAKLGYSDETYEETKKTLIRKFGGNRRRKFFFRKQSKASQAIESIPVRSHVRRPCAGGKKVTSCQNMSVPWQRAALAQKSNHKANLLLISN
jgi:hypothetical protein